jgi:Zn-dependent protease
VSVRPLTPYFRYWRTILAADREVVEAVVRPEHDGPSAELGDALKAWPGTFYWSVREPQGRLVLVPPLRAPRSERWWLHALLFVVTFATVFAGGAMLGAGPISLDSSSGGFGLLDSVRGLSGNLVPGFSFALGLMGILLVHELGHYALAKRYHVDSSPPYFLPAPWQLNFIGTFGAFIRLRSPIVDRRQLIDIGAAGPWTGFVLSVVILVIGLLNSTELAAVSGPTLQFVDVGSQRIFFGDSILMNVARTWLVGEGTVLLHPIALAGWVGLLVTMLNLLPLGQLDGGHVLYALIGRHQAMAGRLTLVGMFVLGRWVWGWWLVWAALVLILGRGRIAHPSVLDPHRPIPSNRIVLGLLTAALFIVTFTPAPFSW